MKIDKKLIILLVLNFLIFLPSLFEPVSYGDECIYLTLGNAFRKGFIFYKDIHDNKPPFLYFIASLSFNRLFWFRLISLAWNLIHLAIIYELIQKITKKKILPFFGGIIFIALYLIFEGRVANGENFMMMPISLAVYLMIKTKKKNFIFGVLMGLLFSAGFLFKVPAGFDFVGLIFGFYFLTIEKINLKTIKKLVTDRALWGTIIGFITPILLSIVYYGLNGAFTPYVRSALLQNIGYLASWQGSNLGIIVRFSLLALISLTLFVFRRKISLYPKIFYAWFGFGLFGALLSGRPYPHYFIEIVPSLIVLIVLALDKKSLIKLIMAISAIGLLIFSYIYFNFWFYPITPYYKNFISWATGNKITEEYLMYWGHGVKENYKLAEFIKKTSDPEKPIFIWGEGSCLYAISDRLPPAKYTVNYHIFDFNGFDETLLAIKEKGVPIIIKLKDEKQVWPELEQLLKTNYFPLKIDGVESKIFLKK